VSDRGCAWDMELSSNIEMEKQVRITVEEEGQIPDSLKLYVLDKDYLCALPISNRTFSIDLKNEFPVRHLQVIVGTADYAKRVSGDVPITPIDFTLKQNYPNPFNSETTIQYQIGKKTRVSIEIYNVLGERIKSLLDQSQNPGTYSVVWDGKDEAGRTVMGGVYLYRMRTEQCDLTRKLALIQ
jgi:hypothetical protein